MEFLLIKWVHILSATILFGTGIGSAFYMYMANRSGDIKNIHFAICHVVAADWLFTTPAIIIQFISGMMLVSLGGFSFADAWILWGLIFYVFVGFCWLPVVWIQIEMRNIVRQAMAANEPLPARYSNLYRYWFILGCLAFPAVVVIFYLMVFKVT